MTKISIKTMALLQYRVTRLDLDNRLVAYFRDMTEALDYAQFYNDAPLDSWMIWFAELKETGAVWCYQGGHGDTEPGAVPCLLITKTK